MVLREGRSKRSRRSYIRTCKLICPFFLNSDQLLPWCAYDPIKLSIGGPISVLLRCSRCSSLPSLMCLYSSSRVTPITKGMLLVLLHSIASMNRVEGYLHSIVEAQLPLNFQSCISRIVETLALPYSAFSTFHGTMFL
jgi:hypothetical protein